MAFKEIDTLFLTFEWVREFFLDNGIVRIPEMLAFALETCGVLFWLLIFVFFVSLLVGYARQMSSFFFFYQHIMGQKLDNPYKPSVVIVALWLSVQVLAGGIALGAVYFMKYGVLVAGAVAIAVVMALAGLAFMTMFITRRMTAKRPPPQTVHHYQHHIPTSPQAQVVHQSAAQDMRYLQGPGAPPPPDAMAEEAMIILGLKPGFTKADLQKRYRDLVKKVHADKGGSDGLYLKVKQCYEYLLTRV